MYVLPDRTPHFGVTIQDELEAWWLKNAGRLLAGYPGEPFVYVCLKQGVTHDWRNPFQHVQHVLTHGERSRFEGLFHNIAGKGRLSLRTGRDSLVGQNPANHGWLRPGDFPYGGWVHDRYGWDAGGSGLPEGRKDHEVVSQIIDAQHALYAAAAAQYVQRVADRDRNAPFEDQLPIKFMLADGWEINEEGMLYRPRPNGGLPAGPGHTRSAAYAYDSQPAGHAGERGAVEQHD